jgi:hypothetical protein
MLLVFITHIDYISTTGLCLDVVGLLLVPVVLLGTPVVAAVPYEGDDVRVGLRKQQAGADTISCISSLVTVE